MIYLDHAATSFPKPPEVVEAVREYMVEIGVNPGRAAYCGAARAAGVVFAAREDLAALLGVPDSRRLVFTRNATEAINLALFGLLRRGDRVVMTSMEHNAVVRPLRALRDRRGVDVEVVRADGLGRVDPVALGAAVDERTRLVVVNHASNVCGTLADLREIRQAVGRVPLLVDAAQTAGMVPIDAVAGGIDLLAVTGHKGLLGPTGTGALYIREGLDPDPLVLGGTGSNSGSDEMPSALPDRYEAGTLNASGIAGLGAAARLLLARGIPSARARDVELSRRLLEGLGGIEGVTLYGPTDPEERTATLSIEVSGTSCDEVAFDLDRRYGIGVRAGLHCAPEAHRTLGTFPRGTVRIACGHSTTDGDVDAVMEALAEIAREAR